MPRAICALSSRPPPWGRDSELIVSDEWIGADSRVEKVSLVTR